MCIIIAKLKNQPLPKKQTLKNCWSNNDDGAGYMYAVGDKVQIKKGFLRFEDFYKSLQSDFKKHDLKSKNLVLHFRIGTSGGLDASKTHPFPLVNNGKQLNATKTKASKGVAHNGVLSGYCYNQKQSDSQNFIQDFLFYIDRIDKNFMSNKDADALILNQLQGDRLAILDGNDNLKLYGDFIKDGGCYYSNQSYTYEPIKNYNFSQLANYGNYYYDDLDNYYYDQYEQYLYDKYEAGEITAGEYDDDISNLDKYNDFINELETKGGDYYEP